MNTDTQPLFTSAEQAITVLWSLVARLSALVMWLAVGLLHTALLALALLALWWTQTTPAEAASAVRSALQTWPASALAAAGVSGLSALAGYGWLLRRLHRAIGKPLADFLLQDS